MRVDKSNGTKQIYLKKLGISKLITYLYNSLKQIDMESIKKDAKKLIKKVITERCNITQQLDVLYKDRDNLPSDAEDKWIKNFADSNKLQSELSVLRSTEQALKQLF